MWRRRDRGFTLIELVIVIVILGILAGVAIPKFFNLTDDAKKAAAKGALGGLRSGVANFYANSATPSGGGTATWPTAAQLTTANTVLAGAVPDNPYDADGTPNNVVATTAAKGTIVGLTGGWAYNDATGEIWANTSVAGENAW